MSQTKVVGKEVFLTDLDFCPRCGTVLPLPELEDMVKCKLCSFQINVDGKYCSIKQTLAVEQQYILQEFPAGYFLLLQIEFEL